MKITVRRGREIKIMYIKRGGGIKLHAKSYNGGDSEILD